MQPRAAFHVPEGTKGAEGEMTTMRHAFTFQSPSLHSSQPGQSLQLACPLRP